MARKQDFREPEPQEERGAPGSRGIGNPPEQEPPRGDQPAREMGAASWTGVNPLDPIDPAMPALKPGDQGG